VTQDVAAAVQVAQEVQEVQMQEQVVEYFMKYLTTM